jgi:ketosteroid isomerase-like protein
MLAPSREGDAMSTEHPARAASQRSMHIVQTKGEGAKQRWLDLFADAAIIEDPVGRSPLDPEGKGHRGKAAVAAFWDLAIASVDIQFDIRSSYACGNEVANVGTITTRMPDGTTARVEGVYTYKVDDAGKILSLRAFWEFDKMVASLSRPQ